MKTQTTVIDQLIFDLQSNLVSIRMALNGEGTIKEEDRVFLARLVERSEEIIVDVVDQLKK